MILITLLIGLVLGLCVGFTSIGTGILGSPALILLLNIDPLIAVGTISLAAIPMKIASSVQYIRAGNIHPRLCILFSLTSLPTAYIAAHFAQNISEILPIRQILGAVILFCLPLLMYTQYRRSHPIQTEHSTKTKQTPKYLLAIPIGLILGPLMGVSGITGSLPLLCFLLIFKLDNKSAVGSANAVGLASITSAALAHLQNGNYDLSILLPLIPAVILGATVAAKHISKIPQKLLHYLILSTVALAATLILTNP